MNLLALPWLEITLLTPIIGAAFVACFRNPPLASRVALVVTVTALVCSLLAWWAMQEGVATQSAVLLLAGQPLFAIDGLSAPLLPLVALLHVLTILTTSKLKANRVSFVGHLLGEFLRLGAFACLQSWPLVILLALNTLPPLVELLQRKKPTRVYVLHMALFVGLLVIGVAGVDLGWRAMASIALLAAVLVRSGTFPAHLWVADLFEHATFGTALLFVTPITGVYAAVRLVLPVAPDWVLTVIGILSLVTAVYAAGMAIIQTDARRFFASLFLSHASLVLVGLELHTTISLTGALCLWVSVAMSLGGLGLMLRTLEARYGRLMLNQYRGLYDQSPALAISFLIAGLCSVGFPGTLGFIAAELLVDGAIHANLLVGLGLVIASAFNGIAIVRVYLLLFTGTRHVSAIDLSITPRERIAVFILAFVILGGGLYPQPGVNNRYEAAKAILHARQSVLPGEVVDNEK
ncbi:proton-conducting transporter membrane subunit [soil metagenome]